MSVCSDASASSHVCARAKVPSKRCVTSTANTTHTVSTRKKYQGAVQSKQFPLYVGKHRRDVRIQLRKYCHLCNIPKECGVAHAFSGIRRTELSRALCSARTCSTVTHSESWTLQAWQVVAQNVPRTRSAHVHASCMTSCTRYPLGSRAPGPMRGAGRTAPHQRMPCTHKCTARTRKVGASVLPKAAAWRPQGSCVPRARARRTRPRINRQI